MSAADTIMVTLPSIEDYAEDVARAGRMTQAADLAGELTPEEFAQWMEQGEAIRANRPQENKEAPSA